MNEWKQLASMLDRIVAIVILVVVVVITSTLQPK